MSEPDYVVIRPAPDLPPEFLPGYLNGRWYDRAELPWGGSSCGWIDAVAVPTGRFEVRDDGAVAEVFEVRP